MYVSRLQERIKKHIRDHVLGFERECVCCEVLKKCLCVTKKKKEFQICVLGEFQFGTKEI